MKKIVIFLCVLSFLLIGFQGMAARRIMEMKIGRGEAKVNVLEGSAQFLQPGKKTWRSLNLGDILKGGDEVSTGSETRLELILPDYSAVRFAGDSHFKVLQVEAGGDSTPRNMKFHVAIGRTWANVSKTVWKKGQFELRSENAVAGVRGTIYRMNVEKDRSALVRVYEGTVHVSGGDPAMEAPKMTGPPEKVSGPTSIPGPKKATMEEWVFIIKSMQQIIIAADGTAEKPRGFTEKEDRDEWVDWNKARDRELGSD